jgi:LuxR family maltose regulon positive regulatory protein
MDVPILQTKLYIPQAAPGDLIARPHLPQRLDEALTRKLTLISAPAGYGKTTW